MPYLEILGPRIGEDEKRAAVRAVTEAIVSAFSVSPSTVTLYFLAVDPEDYGHAGMLRPGANGPRVFAKLHAYRRGITERRAAATGVTHALADCFATSPDHIAVYFIDRTADEVAHGGRMACDDERERGRMPLTSAASE